MNSKKSAAISWIKLRNKLSDLIKFMDEETEKHDHVISHELYNFALLRVIGEFENIEAIKDDTLEGKKTE